MRLQLRSLTAALAVLFSLAAGSRLQAADIYVITNNSFGTGGGLTNFGKIDSSTGAYTNISGYSNSDLYGLAWHDVNQLFYLTDVTGGTFSAPLKTLTTSGTLSSSLGNVTGTLALAYRAADNKLYAYSASSAQTFTIDASNAAKTTLNNAAGATYGSPGGGRYSIMNDVMYMTWSGFPATPSGNFGTMGYTASSTFSSISTDSLYARMNLANDGTTMYGIYGNGTAGQQRLYTIDVSTGALTAGPFITGTGLGTYFHGAAIVPVPEPSTYALAAIASGVMAFVAHRRKARRA
ncbi:PEP-CTERM sorting domain-containing protein [bacterium]|nr:PEP-CTERM sorting domain-containing protein [bacterium]